MAETLPEKGISTLRYNKRGVLPDGELEAEQVQASTLDRLIADLNAVIDKAQMYEEVAEIYLYGWSEGAWVVSNVATQRDDIAGLVLQGAPNGDISTILPYQITEVTLPYLREEADTNADGALTLDEVTMIPPGIAAYHAKFFLYEPNSSDPTLNSFVNRNVDDRINIEYELVPAMSMYLANVSQAVTQVEASYDTAEIVATLELPVLLLHGEMDGWVEIDNAEQIAEAENATLERFPDLGHALSETESPALDAFNRIDPTPIEVLANWINK